MSAPPRLDARTLLLVAWSVLMSVGAQLALRHGMSDLAELGGLALARAATRSTWVLGGIAAYLSGTVSWLIVLSRIDLAVAYPLGSVNYVLVTALSATLLDETVPVLRWVGTGFILVGLLVVAQGERRHAPATMTGAPT